MSPTNEGQQNNTSWSLRKSTNVALSLSGVFEPKHPHGYMSLRESTKNQETGVDGGREIAFDDKSILESTWDIQKFKLFTGRRILSPNTNQKYDNTGREFTSSNLLTEREAVKEKIGSKFSRATRVQSRKKIVPT